MGIIPTGTANVLAQELGIPLKLDEACHLIAEAHDITSIDAMKTGDTIAVLHMGVGLDAELIRQTRREQKRRFGRLAYIWNGLIQIIGYQPRRFSIAADNVHKRFHAANVQIANGGSIGMPILRWGQHIRPDDGQIDVCIVYARNFLDYLKLAGYILLRKQKQSRRIRYLAARRSVAVHCDKPLPVHADGETIGETPVSVQVIPQAVRIAIPRTSQPDDEPQPAETAVELA
jgi:diacylglycerol kinase family enzyme